MSQFLQVTVGTLFGGILTGFGVWIHHALYIRPNQLKIKMHLPPAVKSSLQNEVDILVPVLATKAQQVASDALTGLATTVINKL
jgi:hypothetical protein